MWKCDFSHQYFIKNRLYLSRKQLILQLRNGAHLLFGFASLCPPSPLLLLTQILLYIEGILIVQEQFNNPKLHIALVSLQAC